MLNNKNTMIILIISIVLTLSLLGCDQIFQIQRVDQGEVAKDVKSTQDQEDHEQNKDAEGSENNELEEAKQDAEGNTQNQDNEEKILEDAEEDDKIEATLANIEGFEEALNYLYLSDHREENRLLPKFNFIVGEDHFVQLVAVYNKPSGKNVRVSVKWTDKKGEILYKKEILTLRSNDENKVLISSLLGLSKKTPGQEVIPDSLGEYWVILEVDNKRLSSTKYSIVME